jgi:hypothetical protein
MPRPAALILTALLALGCATPAPRQSAFRDPCDGDTPDACASFVRAVHRASSTRDPSDDNELVRACMGGQLRACEDLYKTEGRLSAQVHRLCELGDLWACSNGWVGWVERNCSGVSFDACREKTLRTCKQGQPELCVVAAAAFKRMRPSYALQLEQLACDGGDAQSCLNAAEQLAAVGPAHDDAAATERFIHACDQGSLRACEEASARISDGSGTTKDPARAIALDDRACLAGSGVACGRSYLGRCVQGDASACYELQSVSRDLPKGFADALQAACEKHNWPACRALAGPGGRAEAAQRIASAEKSPLPCIDAAEGSAQLLPDTQKRLEGLCQGDDLVAAWACDALPKADAKNRSPYAERACKLGDLSACQQLLHSESGPPADEAAIQAIRKDACSAKSRLCAAPPPATDGHGCDQEDVDACRAQLKVYWCDTFLECP